MVGKANKAIESEMGQQIAPLPAVGAVTESRRFAGADGAGGVDYGELAANHAEWVAAEPVRERKKAVREEWRWYDMSSGTPPSLMMSGPARRCSGRRTRLRDVPTEYHQAIWDRKLDRDREKNYEDFERFCANEVAGAFAEYGPDGVTLAEICEGVKWSLPQDAEVRAEVDEWFAGPVCAALVETARKVAPEPDPGSGAWH